MSEWWKAAPVAGPAKTPKASGEWWSEAPIDAGSEFSGVTSSAETFPTPSRAPIPARNVADNNEFLHSIGIADRDVPTPGFGQNLMEIMGKSVVGAPAILADALRLPATANEALIRQFGGTPDEGGLMGAMRGTLRSAADAIDTQPLVDKATALGYGNPTFGDAGDVADAFTPSAPLTMGDRFSTVGRAIPETLAGSGIEMLSAMNPLTLAATIMGKGQENALERAKNDDRADASLVDVGLGAGAGAVEMLLERYTTGRIGDLFKPTGEVSRAGIDILKRVAAETGIQAVGGGVEELVPYLATHVATKTGVDPREAAGTFALGALAESAMGGGASAVTEGARALTRPAEPAPAPAPGIDISEIMGRPFPQADPQAAPDAAPAQAVQPAAADAMAVQQVDEAPPATELPPLPEGITREDLVQAAEAAETPEQQAAALKAMLMFDEQQTTQESANAGQEPQEGAAVPDMPARAQGGVEGRVTSDQAADADVRAGQQEAQGPVASTQPKTTRATVLQGLINRSHGEEAKGVEVLDGLDSLSEADRKRIGFVPEDKGEVEGFYDPDTGKAYVFADSITPYKGQTAEQRALWVAAHERSGHAGLRGMFVGRGTDLVQVLQRMATSPALSELNYAMGLQRREVGDRQTEESFAELAAAVRTGDFKHLSDRYGVDITPEQRGVIKELVERVVAAINKALGGEMRDSEVFRLIEDANRYVKKGQVAPTSARGIAAQAAGDKAIASRVGTRNPTAVKATEKGTDPKALVGYDSSSADKRAFAKNTTILMGYPGVKKLAGRATPERKAEAFIQHVVDNLLALHDAMPANFRDRAKVWYVGANAAANRLADDYGITDIQAAGAIAALSPQKDWFQNLSLAERVIDAHTNQNDRAWDGAMTAKTEEIFGKPQYAEMRAKVEGQPLSALVDPVERGMWTRVYDQTHNDSAYPITAPDGTIISTSTTKAGNPARIQWGSLAEVAKAIGILQSGTQQNVSDVLGKMHKIRSFYNNIIDPNSDLGDVTIDTHAVAAGLMRPLSAAADEVGHNFGTGTANSSITGNQGTYGLYAEAYRRAAAERGVLPREMQSITWEGIRAIFLPSSRRGDGPIFKKANDIWSQFERGEIDHGQAFQNAIDAGGGIRTPDWLGSTGGLDAGKWRKAFRPAVSGAGVSRGSAGPTASRRADSGRAEPVASRRASGKYEPLPGAPRTRDATGPDPRLVGVAESYAKANGIDLRRQSEYVSVDPDRAARIAAAYEAMPHAPNDPRVRKAYESLIDQTTAQYESLKDAGYQFYFDTTGSNPWDAMRQLRSDQTMGVFPTDEGFGSGEAEIDVSDNPLMADTGIQWPDGSLDGELRPVLANDLFRAVHDAFGHGLEGAGFRAAGEENAWQAHVRLFTGDAVGAITTETRGQNSWLNYGPHGEKNRTAKVEDTVFADQKTGLMPEWTWTEGRADSAPAETGSSEPVASRRGIPEGATATLNIGLSTAETRGGGLLSKAEVLAAVRKAGVRVIDSSQHTSDSEPTLVINVDGLLTKAQGDALSAELGQEAIVQRKVDGDGDMFGPKASEWGPYNPAYFMMPDGERAETEGPIASRKGDASGFAAKKRQPDAVAVDAYHYSTTAGLSSLDPKRAGSGGSGRERRRFGMGQFGKNGGTSARVYFYVRGEGEAVPPQEDVVKGAGGQHLYRVRLENMYDADADPRGFLDEAGVNPDYFEELVSDAGFDGFTRSSPGGGIDSAVAIVFDIKGKIPVEPADRGGPIASRRDPQTETPAFKRWFKESAVVESDGAPKPVYHGSKASFDEFSGDYGIEGWFSEDPSLSNRYAKGANRYGGKTEPQAYKAYLSIQNPAEMSFDMNDPIESVWDDARKIGIDDPEALWPARGPRSQTAAWSAVHSEEFTDALVSAGFDGIKVLEDGVVTWGAVRATQIKSATGNSGAFDGSNPSIIASRRGDTGASVIQEGRLLTLIDQVKAAGVDLKPIMRAVMQRDVVAQELAIDAALAAMQAKTPRVTGIKNEITDVERAEAGRDPILRDAVKTNEETLAEAMRALKADPSIGEEVVRRLANRGPAAISLADEAILLVHKTRLMNARNAAADKLASDKASAEAKEVARKDWEAAEAELATIDYASVNAGREWGRMGQFRQRMLREDFTLEAMERKERARLERPLTSAEAATIKVMADKIAAQQKKLEAMQARLQNLESERAAAAVTKAVVRPPKARPSLDRLRAAADAARARLRAQPAVASRRGQSGAVMNPAALADLAIIGAYHVANGAATLSDFVAAMREDLGDMFDAFKADHPKIFGEAKREAARPTKAGATQDVVAEVIDPDALTSADIGRLAEAHVRAGVRGEASLIAAIQKSLVGIVELSDRDVRRLFSDYGNAQFPSQEEAKVELRKLRALMQLQESIDRIEEGLAPLRSGPQRDAMQQQVRERRTELNELLKTLEGDSKSPAQMRTYNDMRVRNLTNQIEDLEKQIATGERPERKPSPAQAAEVEALIVRRDALREERDRAGAGARRYEAEKAALRKQIEAVEARMRGEVKPKAGPEQRVEDLEMTKLRERLEKMRARRDSMTREEAAKSRIGEQISRLMQRLAGMEKPAPREKRVDSPEVAEMKRIRDELATDLRELERAEVDQEQRYQEVRGRQIQRRIEDLQARIAAGDFAARPRIVRELSKANELAAYELDKVKEEFLDYQFKENLKNRTPLGKIFGTVGEVLNLSRAIMTSLDLSAILRQGGFISFAHPLRALSSVGPSLQAFASDKADHRLTKQLENRANAPLYRKYGLQLTSIGAGPLTRVEEKYAARWLDSLPTAIGGGLVRGSGRAYTAFLNKLRADTFDAMAAALGKKQELTEAEGKAIANFINVSTGRGKIGVSENAGEALNTVFFAPRLVASRFQLLIGQPMYGGNARTKRMIAMEYARFLTGVSIVISMAALMIQPDDDDDKPVIELDPRSSAFGKIRYGNTYLDPLVGLSQVTVLVSRLATGETVTGKGEAKPLREGYTLTGLRRALGADIPAHEMSPDGSLPFGSGDGSAVIGRFLRTKMAPVPGAILSAVSGTNVVGESKTLLETGRELVTPMSFQDVGDLMEEHGAPKTAVIVSLALLGMGMNHHKQDDARQLAEFNDGIKAVKEDVSERLMALPVDEWKGAMAEMKKEYGAALEGIDLDYYKADGKYGSRGEPKRDKDGKPRLKSDRLSKPEAYRANVEGMRPDDQVHHIIPDNLARRHPLMAAARKAGYDLDQASNLIAMPGQKTEATESGKELGHRTSHPTYDSQVFGQLTRAKRELEKKHGSLDKVPDDELMKRVQEIEQEFRKKIEAQDVPKKDGRLAARDPSRGGRANV